VEETGGALYLLRLHQPVLDYWSGERQRPEYIASELTWLEALAEGGFLVQRPLRTREGSLVASPALDGAGKVPATLLTWLGGRHISVTDAGPDQDAALEVECFGELVGRLHEFSARWTPPPGFVRPSYDEDYFQRLFARLLHKVDPAVFSQEVFWTLQATCRKIIDDIHRLPVEPETWGMIHADLHMGNILVQDGAAQPSIVPIDFSFCGFGHYLFDLSVCLTGGLNQALRPAFLKGYRARRPLAESALGVAEAFNLASRLSYFAYQIDNPAERAWLQRRLSDVVANDCARFLNAAA
jgi:Ser/Thr protein kinase RdoA (MazF antagonist)